MIDQATKAHLREVRKQLRASLVHSYKGWWYWHTIIKKYKGSHIDNTAVILMPSTDHNINYLALRNLDQFLARKVFDNALILTHSEVVKKAAPLFSKKILAVEWFPRKKAEDLMQYYCLRNFDRRLYIMSLDEPKGRNGGLLVGKNGTTREEVFMMGVYRMAGYQQLPILHYDGEDEDIKSFLKVDIR